MPKKVRITAYLDAETKQQFQNLCEKNCLIGTKILENLIINWVEDKTNLDKKGVENEKNH